MDYETVNSPSYPTPNWSQFGDTIGNLANTFRSGQQQNQQQAISTAFQNGIPIDPATGQPDINKMMQILAQKGGIPQAMALLGPSMDQRQLQQAQSRVGPAPVAGAPTGGPTAPTGQPLGSGAGVPSVPRVAAPQAAAPVTNVPAPGGAQLGDLSGASSAFPSAQALVSSAVPDPGKASQVTAFVAKSLKIDPAAPMTQDQAEKTQRFLAAVQRDSSTGGSGGDYADTRQGHESFIRAYAASKGLDPDVVTKIAQAEGLRALSPKNPNSASGVDIGADGKPFSFGDFQDNVRDGLGVDLRKEGIDPADPKQWQAADKGSIDYMADKGLGPWKGDAEVNALAKQQAPGGGDLPPASAAAGIPTRRPPSNEVADNSAQPLVPQYPLPVDPRTGQRYTDPKTAILGLDDEMKNLTGNRFATERIKVLQNEQDRIISSITPMKVSPSDTFVNPSNPSGKPVYQGAWAGSAGMLSGPALDQAAETYYQTGKPPPNLGRGVQGAAGLNAIITRAAEIHQDDPVENWPERQAQFKTEKGFTGQVADLSEAIKKGDQPPVLTGLYGLSGPIRQRLEKDGFDLSKAQLEWQRAQKQITSLNGPQQVRFVGLASSVVNTIDEVRDLSEQMKLSGVPIANRAEMATYAQTQGNTANGQLTARYIAAVNTLKEEFANLANGGYAPTEAAWALANGQINGDYGVKQLGASLDEVQRLINYRLKAMPGLSTMGPGAPNTYLPQQGSANPGAAPPQPGAPAGAAPQPDKDGWITLPGGIRIREAQ
jgi:hypothetical protein